jgi:hypothetical protein
VALIQYLYSANTWRSVLAECINSHVRYPVRGRDGGGGCTCSCAIRRSNNRIPFGNAIKQLVHFVTTIIHWTWLPRICTMYGVLANRKHIIDTGVLRAEPLAAAKYGHLPTGCTLTQGNWTYGNSLMWRNSWIRLICYQLK